MKAKAICSFAILVFIFLGSSSLKAEDWKLYKSQDGLKIFTSIQQVTVKGEKINYLVFKYVNTNDFAIDFSWKINVWYNGVCRACDIKDETDYNQKLTLKPKETIMGKAGDSSKGFSIFYSMESKKYVPLDKFEFEGLMIKKLQ